MKRQSISGTVEYTEDEADWLSLLLRVDYDADMGCDPTIDYENGSSPGEGTSVEITRVTMTEMVIETAPGFPAITIPAVQLYVPFVQRREKWLRMEMNNSDHPIHARCVADAERHQ